MMKTVTMNPSALTAITAWLSAREAEKELARVRRKLEDQILIFTRDCWRA